MKPTEPPALITFPAGARRLGVMPQTAEKLAKDGRFPRPFWFGGTDARLEGRSSSSRS